MQRTASLKRTAYGNKKTDKQNHMIHLEGEMDFKRTATLRQVYRTLSNRAEQIGGLVSINKEKAEVKVTCWNSINFILKAETLDKPVKQVVSIDKAPRDSDKAKAVTTHTMEELEEKAETTEKLLDAYNKKLEHA